ncbi:hypothetical protein, partial [Bradyrhizobium sp.]|uniref:hypothetical protein n=1 Tax=Bradyrhizobium sp. TaxID=376 RepID=UPI0025C266AE
DAPHLPGARQRAPQKQRHRIDRMMKDQTQERRPNIGPVAADQESSRQELLQAKDDALRDD